jgi:tetratricopeptide (TPR) repeat protein
MADDRAKLQLIVSLASSGDVPSAEREARAIVDKTTASEAWLVIGRANANMQRWDQAHAALENASQFAPDSAILRLEIALLAERRGRHDEALAQFEALSEAEPGSPQLLVHLARALQFAGRDAEARGRLEAGIARWPLEVALHQQLAQLRWRSGDGEHCTSELERVIAAHPQQLGLRLVAADLLRNGGFGERAAGLLERGLALAPDSPAFLTSMGVVLDDLGRDAEALKLLRAAVTRAPQSVPARRNLVPALLRAAQPREALRVLAELLALTPDDQQLIAWRATALRLAGDAEYARLHDYPRLVRSYELQPTAEYTDIHAFNAAFSRELTALHRATQRPLAQSLRGGTQTERNLPRENPVIAAFFAMLDAPIRDYLTHLDAASVHPTDRRKRAGYRIAGSWSVQLKPEGFHTNHVHPMGWLSSAYYVELPARDDTVTRAGWIKFGEPGMERPVCAADHFVEPRVGTLVLFPSYLWHGTVPFSGGGRRLTAAFDVVPD